MTRYLSEEDILVIHARIIDKVGGIHGIRDVGLLSSIVKRPRTAIGGKEMFETLFEKGVTLLEAIAQYHVFTDGNKRTSIAVATRFLHLNGYVLSTTNNEIEKFVLKVAKKKADLNAVAKWLQKNSKER